MKPAKRILWGVVLVALGILFALKVFGLEFDVFFPGWWTLFIIVPCGISVITDKDKTAGAIGLLIGVVLLALKQKWIPWLTLKNIWQLIIPVVLVGIGLSMILKGSADRQPKEAIKQLNSQSLPMADCRAFFSRKQLDYSRPFNKANLVAVCGSLSCDLMNGIINNDIVINTHCFFGTINITVPEGVNVKVVSTSVFGGVNNKHQQLYEGTPTIYINNTAFISGVNIL